MPTLQTLCATGELYRHTTNTDLYEFLDTLISNTNLLETVLKSFILYLKIN